MKIHSDGSTLMLLLLIGRISESFLILQVSYHLINVLKFSGKLLGEKLSKVQNISIIFKKSPHFNSVIKLMKHEITRKSDSQEQSSAAGHGFTLSSTSLREKYRLVPLQAKLFCCRGFGVDTRPMK